MSQTESTALAPKKPKGGRATLIDKFGLAPDAMTPVERTSAISGYDMRHRIESMVAGVTKKKIKHIYKGDGAATAPGLMILPRIPATNLFSLKHARILLGYTAHEIAHQLHTDFDMLVRLLDDTTRENRQKQQIKEFWNAIEDYRIEKLVPREYPGFHVYIDSTREFSARRFCEAVDEGMYPAEALANPYRIGSVALTWIGAELNKYRATAPTEALAKLDPDLRAWIESWRPDMTAVNTCEEARDLAIVIVEELDRLRQEPPPPEEKEDGQGQEGEGGSGGTSGPTSKGKSKKGDAGDKPDEKQESDTSQQEDESPNSPTEDGDQDAEDNNPGQGADADGEPGDDGGANGEEKDDPKDGNGQEDGATQDDAGDQGGAEQAEGPASEGDQSPTKSDGPGGSSAPRPQLQVKDGDEQAAAEAADLEIDELSKAINSLKGTEATTPTVSDENEVAGLSQTDKDIARKNVERGQSDYAQIRREVGTAAARGAGVMRRLLQSQARRTWQGGKDEGELDFGRLVPMVRGSADVYRQRQERVSVNTAVSLLLDNSGSMTGHPIRMCQETAVVLDMAIQGTRTNVEITGFTGCTTHPVLYRYRAFGQKGQASSASLGNMTRVELGGTPVSTPLLEAWRRMSQQKEPKHIMIVVSDGGADYNDVSASREAHDFIVRQGCKILGIAIGDDSQMKAWCDNVQGIDSIDELPVALTALVQEALK